MIYRYCLIRQKICIVWLEKKIYTKYRGLRLWGQIGAPYIATTVAGMTDKTRVYVYQGSEPGYTSGNWYYWNGSAWTSGGTYNSAAVNTDKTLTQSDKPADSAIVGKEIGSLKESLSNKITKFYASNEGKNHLADSDNGKIMDMMLYGKSEQFTTTGKNLLKIKDVTQTTRGVTVTAKDGVVALKGTATETGWAMLDIDSFVLDGTCILSSNVATNTRVSVANKSYKLVLEQNKSNTLENAEVSKVCFNITEGKTYDISNILIQIEKGSVATSYEPYTGGIPSPNPDYPQEIKSVVNPTVKIVGKNLLNATLKTITLNGVTCINNGDGTYTLNGTPTIETDFYIYGAFNTANRLPLDSQKTYIVKKSGNSKIQFHVGEPGIYTTVASLEDGQIKNRATISFFICRILSGAILNNFTIYPQVEEGSASTDFQPYHEQTVALPYTLNAIPVSSGGNVTINGQQYVADYVDVERGKVVRKCERKTLNTKNGKIDGEYRLSINIAPTTYNDGSRECVFSTFKWSNWGTCAAGRTIYIKEIKKTK